MTRERLENYRSIRDELAELQKELNHSGELVTDTVAGSSAEYPYCKHPVPSAGYSRGRPPIRFLQGWGKRNSS